MIQCMEDVRRDRLKNERRRVLRQRWKSILDTLLELSRRPEARAHDISLGDIALMPEIREIMDAADDVVVDETSLDEVVANFSGMIERWKDTAATQLRKLIMESRPVTDALQRETRRMTRKGKAKAQAEHRPDVLELATTRFHCKRCNEKSKALYYPGLLSHECLRDHSHSEEEDVYKDFVLRQVEDLQVYTMPLYYFDLLQVAQPSAAAAAVIRLCGKDPEVATAEEMNALNVMLLRGDTMIRTWRSAVRVPFLSYYVALFVRRRRYSSTTPRGVRANGPWRLPMRLRQRTNTRQTSRNDSPAIGACGVTVSTGTVGRGAPTRPSSISERSERLRR